MRLVAIALALTGCYPKHPAIAPDEVVALEALNTELDDYNAAQPRSWHQMVYSSNRGSQGAHLDMWITELDWRPPFRLVRTPVVYAPQLASNADERGPIRFFDDVNNRMAVLFASDREGGAGGLDLYLAGERDDAPVRLAELSTSANEAYLTLPYGTQALFASDRGGAGWDLYEVTWTEPRVDAPVAKIDRVAVLSSEAEDHAPYVEPETGYVVFASRRDGGRGGSDVWCSRGSDGRWAPPQPMTRVNSPADEFRPSIARIDDVAFLVFSSNRAGGKGGFDLYTTKFDGC